MSLILNKVDVLFYLYFGDLSPNFERIKAISRLFGKKIEQTQAWLEAARKIFIFHDIKFPEAVNEPLDYGKLFGKFRPFIQTRTQANEINGVVFPVFDKKNEGIKKSFI